MAARAREHKEVGIRRRDRRDPTNDKLMFSGVFVYASQALGVTAPELYLRQDWPGEIEMMNAREKQQLCPAFVVGAALLQGKQEKELAYVLGKKLTLMRPDHVVRWPAVVPQVSELKAYFLAALKLVQPNVPIKSDMEQPVRSVWNFCAAWFRPRTSSSWLRWFGVSSRARPKPICTAGARRWTTRHRGLASSCATTSRWPPTKSSPSPWR